jgi:hypothetical protein
VVVLTVGFELTVTDVVAVPVHPFAVTEYVIVTVPEATPVTTPELLTVAFVLSLDDQVPPGVVLLKVVVLPAQTFVVPEIEATVGVGFTVTVAVLVRVALQLGDAVAVATTE